MHALDGHYGAVRVEDVYDTGIDDLWNACTDPDRLARWIADVDGDLQVGGTFYATFTSTGAGAGRIEACDPPNHLLLVMLPETDDEQQIEAWLTADGDRTRLVVENRRIPLTELHLHGAGWQAHLEDLARSLAGKPSIWNTRWNELSPVYKTMQIV
ncbi:SRPBCC family protein [Rudaeicoccus suwonensis]|nr:SRPBCC family protein [Rudaeicoccus suwonensis]